MKKIICFITAAVMLFSCIMVQTDNAAAKTSKTKYLIQVNRKANVVTAYQKINGKYKPIRTMLVSCGRKGVYSTTPKGTFSVKKKWKWEVLYGGTYGRYAIQFYRDYLFHTVGYKTRGNAKSINVKNYNKLGKTVSAGCVRMSYIDEKWLYDNCPKGTKVKVYSSKKPGPLGKPKAVKLRTSKKYYYDPTDPTRKNKKYNLKAPAVTIKKADTAEYGSLFDPKSGVTAKDSRTKQDLTSKIKYTVQKQQEDGSWLPSGTVDTTDAGGVYRIDYTCYYKYCSKYTGRNSLTVTIGQKPEEKESI
ncbi:MAG: L,D-transpeptidase [Eubacteriaceae bacterium]|nr:L,D-transpeptidase [Eubacteriaceae bacterium]